MNNPPRHRSIASFVVAALVVISASAPGCSSSKTNDPFTACFDPAATSGDAGGAEGGPSDAGGDAGTTPRGCPTKEIAQKYLKDFCEDVPSEMISGPFAPGTTDGGVVGSGPCCYTARWPPCSDVN